MIPLFRPSCTSLEIRYVTRALASGWWGMGPKVEEFEHKFAAWAGAQHAVATNSATAALQITMQAMGVTHGEVIVPGLTFVSTALAALHNHNKVVFADIDETSLCMDWDDATAKRTHDTRAAVLVWYGGTIAAPVFNPLPGLPLIEDCAHAAGTVNAGALGQAACWSFHAVKNLATGDGGMVTTDSAALARKLRALRWCGIDKSTWERDQGRYGWEYDITEPGHKAHMNDLTAALGLAQLERLEVMNEARRHLARRYIDELKDLEWLRLPGYGDHLSWHLFVARVDAADRDRFVTHLLSRGVSAGVHYKPLNHYPVFGPFQPLPAADRVWKTLVTLPLFPAMTQAEHDTVVAAIKSFA